MKPLPWRAPLRAASGFIVFAIDSLTAHSGQSAPFTGLAGARGACVPFADAPAAHSRRRHEPTYPSPLAARVVLGDRPRRWRLDGGRAELQLRRSPPEVD